METVAVQGNAFTLDCQVTGQPTPTVTWFRGSAQIAGDDSSRLSVDAMGRLVFGTVFSTDAGSYRCTATNEVDTVSADTTLQVLGKQSNYSDRLCVPLYHFSSPVVVPVIQVATPTVTASDGAIAVLDCLATGNPPPVVTWSFNSISLPNPGQPRIQQAANNSLVFSPVREADEGSYICQATNIAGTESATMRLTVHGEHCHEKDNHSK